MTLTTPGESEATKPHHGRLPPLLQQAERLIAANLGPDRDSLTADGLRGKARGLQEMAPSGALLVVHPRHLPPSVLAPHLRLPTTTGGRTIEKEGFVVVDMCDVDEFLPIEGTNVPEADVYAVAGLDRGDGMANWSPEEALPEILKRRHSPLTVAEGIHWVLQDPNVLERNRCFMTIASRLRRENGTFDARTPAIWISNGTGRDGKERRGAPKVGWCWWGNRHAWLGIASASRRLAV